jgi:hypothetical protein
MTLHHSQLAQIAIARLARLFRVRRKGHIHVVGGEVVEIGTRHLKSNWNYGYCGVERGLGVGRLDMDRRHGLVACRGRHRRWMEDGLLSELFI